MNGWWRKAIAYGAQVALTQLLIYLKVSPIVIGTIVVL
jgi:hypothetical protein